jgi:hypothetical protein
LIDWIPDIVKLVLLFSQEECKNANLMVKLKADTRVPVM